MKIFKKILLAVLTILPAVYTAAAVIFFLPDIVPAHFGADGAVDRYGSKYEAFIIPGVILLVGLIYLVIRTVIAKASSDENDRTARSLDVMDTVILLLIVLLNALDVFILLLMGRVTSVRDPGSISSVILSAVIGVVFILLGNLMPKTKRNAFIGMRLKFTMDTDEHWYIANRAGGIALVISGLVTVAAGLILRSVGYVFVMCIALLVTLTVASVYSYVIIKKENQKTSE